MARTKFDGNVHKVDNPPPAPVKQPLPPGGASGVPAVNSPTVDATAMEGVKMVNPTPMNPPVFKVEKNPIPIKRYRVLNFARVVARGSTVELRPGMTVSALCDDIASMLNGGVKLEEIK